MVKAHPMLILFLSLIIGLVFMIASTETPYFREIRINVSPLLTVCFVAVGVAIFLPGLIQAPGTSAFW